MINPIIYYFPYVYFYLGWVFVYTCCKNKLLLYSQLFIEEKKGGHNGALI